MEPLPEAADWDIASYDTSETMEIQNDDGTTTLYEHEYIVPALGESYWVVVATVLEGQSYE